MAEPPGAGRDDDDLVKAYSAGNLRLWHLRRRLVLGSVHLAWFLATYGRGALKRSLDLLIGGTALLLGLPLMALTALAVKLDSPGPVLFRQTRVGRWGRHFVCYKFRSMYLDAEARKAELDARNEAQGPIFKMRDDPRITRVGRVIRRLSIDELPQLLNVLQGSMSVVGPRPPLPEEVAQYTQEQRKRLEIKPGLTCIWQVSGRSTVGFDEWVRMDLQYIEGESLWMDLRLLLRTVPAVLFGKGAY